ncbi:MAG: IS66 family transposase [Oscillospiraceae bacterium]
MPTKPHYRVLHEPGKAPQSEKLYVAVPLPAGIPTSPLSCTNTSRDVGPKHPEAFLKGFKGYLHTDGYAGYHNLPEEITVVSCWAHARRKFDEAVRSLPKGKSKGQFRISGIDLLQSSFRDRTGNCGQNNRRAL